MGSEFLISANLKLYLTLWLSALTLSVLVVIYKRRSIVLIQKPYWLFLFEPWKLISFILATLIITMAAPYSGDPTWDFLDSLIISATVFVLAPWSVAVLFRTIKARKINAQSLVALCFLFIPCWTYDLYILLRDKMYPLAWYENLFISGAITIIAGLFWNLYYSKEHGLTFAFRIDSWPSVGFTPFNKVLLPCILLSMPVIASIGWFVYTYFFN